MHFALTQRIDYFPIFVFGTCGANVSMILVLESFLNFNDSDPVSYKHGTYMKRRVSFMKISFLMFQKLRPK